MSMARDERELNKTIRQLKAKVRQLRKQLDITESELYLVKSLWEQDVIDMAKQIRRDKIKEKKEHPLCPECGNDTLTSSVIGVWKLDRCSACDFFNRKEIE